MQKQMVELEAQQRANAKELDAAAAEVQASRTMLEEFHAAHASLDKGKPEEEPWLAQMGEWLGKAAEPSDKLQKLKQAFEESRAEIAERLSARVQGGSALETHAEEVAGVEGNAMAVSQPSLQPLQQPPPEPEVDQRQCEAMQQFFMDNPGASTSCRAGGASGVGPTRGAGQARRAGSCPWR